MAEHHFGGEWTTEKLERVRKYLQAYTRIFASNPKAQYYTTTYVDAFAGTGNRLEETSEDEIDSMFDVSRDADVMKYKDGSARIALDIDPKFDNYIFVESNKGRISDLSLLAQKYPESSIQIERDDANCFLKQWCRNVNWRRNRAVVFLDPYGMQVKWSTLQSIASTDAIDVWILFPLGIAVNRLLKRNAPPTNKWAAALTRTFGTDEWESEFYPKRLQKTLWGDDEMQHKEATFESIGRFWVQRLGTIFAAVAKNPLLLRNSSHNPIYLLSFACANKSKSETAIRIAQHILKP